MEITTRSEPQPPFRGRAPGGARPRAGLGLPAALALVMAGTLVAGGCAAPASQTADDEQSVLVGGRGPARRLPPSVLRDACPERRFVGIRRGSTCPAPGQSTFGRWTVGSPFESRYHAGPVPAALDGFCQYDWSGRGAPDLSVLPSEGRRPALDWLEADCQVVAPLGGSFETRLAPSLRDAFLAQAGATGLPVSAVRERASLVSVIDSSSSRVGIGFAHGGRYDHGYNVARVIRELACADPHDRLPGVGCMAYVDLPLALPRVDADTVDYNQGGYFGSQLDLATGIFDALARFDDQGTLPIDRQIINLSVGWSPRWGGTNPRSAQTPVPIRAVFAALEYARCQGALIVAAAGNVEGGGASSAGLMFPAAWTTEVAVCGGTSAPLLHAVGGVNHADDPLANGRPAGHPRFVAPADHAVSLDRPTSPTPGYTSALSGTSVSAAVLSAAAAVVWGYRPELTPDQVMETVYQGSVDLQVPADVCAGNSCSVRRVSLCRATHAACAYALGGSACPSTLPVCPAVGADDAPQEVFGGQPIIAQLMASVTTQFPFAGTDLGFVPACGANVIASSTSPSEICPLQSHDTWIAAPYVDPQPSEPVCPQCFLKKGPSGWNGYFEVNPGMATAAEHVTLDVTVDGDGHIFGLDPGQWNAGDMFEITDIPLPEGNIEKVALTYTVVEHNGDAYVGSEPLLVYE